MWVIGKVLPTLPGTRCGHDCYYSICFTIPQYYICPNAVLITIITTESQQRGGSQMCPAGAQHEFRIEMISLCVIAFLLVLFIDISVPLGTDGLELACFDLLTALRS